MYNILTILHTLTFAAFIHYDVKYILSILIGFTTSSIYCYWQFKIVPTKEKVIYLIYPIILGLLLVIIYKADPL
jgi:hypothetical protein